MKKCVLCQRTITGESVPLMGSDFHPRCAELYDEMETKIAAKNAAEAA